MCFCYNFDTIPLNNFAAVVRIQKVVDADDSGVYLSAAAYDKRISAAKKACSAYFRFNAGFALRRDNSSSRQKRLRKKTTLLRLIAGLEQPEHGKISFIHNQETIQPKNRYGFFQESRLLPWLNVAENIMLSQNKWSDADVLPFWNWWA